MSYDNLAGRARVAFKCSDELNQMLEAVARFENRPVSSVCRLALKNYFTDQGYFDPDNITRLAAGARENK